MAKWLCTNVLTWCVSGFVSLFTLAKQLDLNLEESLRLVSFCSWSSALLSPTILAVGGGGAKVSPTPPSSNFKSNGLCEQLDHHFGALFFYFSHLCRKWPMERCGEKPWWGGNLGLLSSHTSWKSRVNSEQASRYITTTPLIPRSHLQMQTCYGQGGM